MATLILPDELEALFSAHDNPIELIEAFMPVFCSLIGADRVFVSPRNPFTRVCTIFKWRKNESIPWPEIPTGKRVGDWIIEDKWEEEDPLFRAALNLQRSIFVENLQKAASAGILNLKFETTYMFHTAFIHGHAHLPAISEELVGNERRLFWGSVQPAVFDGPRVWEGEIRELVERCLVRIAPVLKRVVESAPGLVDFEE